jgi:hypothetical protein
MGFSSTTFVFLTGSTFFGSSFGSSFTCFGVFENCFGGGICGFSSSSSLIIASSSFYLKITASLTFLVFFSLFGLSIFSKSPLAIASRFNLAFSLIVAIYSFASILPFANHATPIFLF